MSSRLNPSGSHKTQSPNACALGSLFCGAGGNFFHYMNGAGCRYFNSATPFKISGNLFESHETVSQTVSSGSANKICALVGRYFVLAEPEGFEPSRALTPCLVSSEVLSTTQPRLHIFYCTLETTASFHPLQTRFTASSVPESTLGIR